MSSPVPDHRTPEFRDVTAETFRTDILPTARPAILRGLVADWPAVQAGRDSPEALADHIRGFDNGTPVRFTEGAPSIQGRFFYNDDLSGVNFDQREGTVASVLDRLLTLQEDADPPAVAMQSIPEPQALPGFARANPSPLLGEDVFPRLWIGNAATVHTHHDMNDNIACAVAGRRRVILFPPDQTRNLYIGPFERTPAGPPVSMVSVVEPDLERHPRFVEAWAAAEVADLEPGDALFIPSLWWHHVRATASLSMLVNYWWDAGPAGAPSPFDAMVLSLAALRGLPVERRRAWRAFYDHYVFEADEATHAHLPPNRRGVLGPLTPTTLDRIRRFVVAALSRR